MITRKTADRVATPGNAEATCPECRVNQVEPPFDYCSMCEMLSLYFREKLASAEQRRDIALFKAAYIKWRDSLTWAQIETLRDEFWTPSRQARARAIR